VTLKTNMQADLSGGVVKFSLRGVPVKTAYDVLWRKHRIATSSTPSGDSEGIRFSPHIYNTYEQIDAAVAAVKQLAG
jgi:selenocysteine lyase/cysteine desulfurase